MKTGPLSFQGNALIICNKGILYLIIGDERIYNLFYRHVSKCLDRSF